MGPGKYIRTKEILLKQSLAQKGRKYPNRIMRDITGDKNPNWRGGIRNDNGYIVIYSPNHPNKKRYGDVYEQVLIMEKHIGRYLEKNEVVHHINGIKNDNRLENLQLMTKTEHRSYHMKLQILQGKMKSKI